MPHRCRSSARTSGCRRRCSRARLTARGGPQRPRHPPPRCYHPRMKLRTRLNLVVTGLTAVFVAVLLTAEIQNTRSSVREEIEAANGVASQLLGRLAVIYSRTGGTQVVTEFLEQLGHIRANDIILRTPAG